MSRNYSSTAADTTLTAGVSAAATTVTVGSTTGFPAVPYILALSAGSATQELVLVTAVGGLSLTVTRGYDSTVATTHDTGAVVSHSHAAIDFRESRAHEAATAAHGATGAVVGTTNVQTLTNKTLTAPTLTAPVASGSLAGFGDAWTEYTPTLTASSVSPTLGTGSAAVGRYIQIGKLVIFQGRIAFGTSGTAAGTGNYRVSLPVDASTVIPSRRVGEATVFDSSASQLAWGNAVITAATYFELFYPTALPLGGAGQVGAAAPMAFGASDEIHWSIVYQAA